MAGTGRREGLRGGRRSPTGGLGQGEQGYGSAGRVMVLC